MRILDLSGKNFDEIKFNKETFIVMCYVNKVIVFETGEECNKFKRVLEEGLRNSLSDEEDMELECCLGSLIDAFEEEYFLVDEGEYPGRNLVIKNISSELDKYNFNDTIGVYFGVLNSKDQWHELNEIELLTKYLNRFFESEFFDKRCTKETQKLMRDINEVFIEDINLWKKEDRHYFEVNVKND